MVVIRKVNDLLKPQGRTFYRRKPGEGARFSRKELDRLFRSPSPKVRTIDTNKVNLLASTALKTNNITLLKALLRSNAHTINVKNLLREALRESDDEVFNFLKEQVPEQERLSLIDLNFVFHAIRYSTDTAKTVNRLLTLAPAAVAIIENLLNDKGQGTLFYFLGEVPDRREILVKAINDLATAPQVEAQPDPSEQIAALQRQVASMRERIKELEELLEAKDDTSKQIAALQRQVASRKQRIKDLEKANREFEASMLEDYLKMDNLVITLNSKLDPSSIINLIINLKDKKDQDFRTRLLEKLPHHRAKIPAEAAHKLLGFLIDNNLDDLIIQLGTEFWVKSLEGSQFKTCSDIIGKLSKPTLINTVAVPVLLQLPDRYFMHVLSHTYDYISSFAITHYKEYRTNPFNEEHSLPQMTPNSESKLRERVLSIVQKPK